MHRPGVEPAIFRSLVLRPITRPGLAYTTEPTRVGPYIGFRGLRLHIDTGALPLNPAVGTSVPKAFVLTLSRNLGYTPASVVAARRARSSTPFPGVCCSVPAAIVSWRSSVAVR